MKSRRTLPRWRADLIGNARDQKIKVGKQSQSLRKPIRRAKQLPNDRYDVFKDIARLESGTDVSDIGFMLVATDHRHYVDQTSYSDVTSDFDFRHRSQYLSGNTLNYKTGGYGQPISLTGELRLTRQSPACVPPPPQP